MLIVGRQRPAIIKFSLSLEEETMTPQAIMGLIMLLVAPAILVYALDESWYWYPVLVLVCFLFGFKRGRK